MALRRTSIGRTIALVIVALHATAWGGGVTTTTTTTTGTTDTVSTTTTTSSTTSTTSGGCAPFAPTCGGACDNGGICTDIGLALAHVKTIGSNGRVDATTNFALTVAANGVPTGHAVIVAFALNPSAATLSCSDSRGNTYTADADVTNGSGSTGVRTVVFSTNVTTALEAGDTITLTFDTLVQAKAAVAHEFRGLVTASMVDQTSTATGNGTSPNSAATATTSQAEELLVGAIGIENDSNAVVTPGIDYVALEARGSGTMGAPSGHVRIDPEYRVVTATGAYAADGTIIAANWAAAIVTYKGDGLRACECVTTTTTTTTTTSTTTTTTSSTTTSTTSITSTSSTSSTLSTTSTLAATTTTLPFDACAATPVGPTFVSLDCRLRALNERIQSEGALGASAPKLTSALGDAQARAAEASSLCRSGDAKHARSRLKRAARGLVQFGRRLRGRAARRTIPAALRSELIDAGVGLKQDVGRLRADLDCPAAAPEAQRSQSSLLGSTGLPSISTS